MFNIIWYILIKSYKYTNNTNSPLLRENSNMESGELDFGVKKVYKSPKSIHRADAKGLTSSSKLSVSCVLTLQTLPLITLLNNICWRNNIRIMEGYQELFLDY